MNISYNWIKNKLNNFNPSIEELNNCFNSLGFEVESIKNYNQNKNLLIAKIISFKRIEGSDHLNYCILEDLNGKRYEVVCGANNLIINHFVYYAPVGSTIYNGLTLKSKEIKGVESQGMICSLEEIGVPKHHLNDEEQEGIILIEPSNINIEKDNSYNINALGLNDIIFDISITFNREECYAIHNLLVEIAFFFKIDLKQESMIDYPELDLQYNINTEPFEFLNVYLCKKNNKKVNFKDYFWAKQYQTPNINVIEYYNFLKIKDRIEYGLSLITIDESNFQNIDFLLEQNNNSLLIKHKNNTLEYNIDNDPKINENDGSYVYILTFKLKNKYMSKKLDDIHYNKSLIKKIYLNDYNSIFQSNEIIKFKNIIDLNLKNRELEFHLSDCYKLLGYELDDNQFLSTLENINFKFIKKNKAYKVIIPINRQDIFSPSCLLEEYLRLNSYDNIKLIPYQFQPKYKKPNYLDFIDYYLIGNGYNNIKTYNLTSEQNHNMFNFNNLSKLKISNPITSNHAIMQPNILSNVFDVFVYNNKNKTINCNFYEIKDIYISLDIRCKHLFLSNQNHIISHVKNNQKINADFYYLKNNLLNILREFLNIDNKNIEFVPIKKSNDLKLHIYQSFNILYKGLNIGIIGSIDPMLIKKNKMQNFFFAEICLDKIQYEKIDIYEQNNKYINNNIYKDITYYENDSKYKDISNLLYENELVQEVNIKDYYENNNNPKITLTITFNSTNIILNNNLINQNIDNIKEKLQELGVKIDE